MILSFNMFLYICCIYIIWSSLRIIFYEKCPRKCSNHVYAFTCHVSPFYTSFSQDLKFKFWIYLPGYVGSLFSSIFCFNTATWNLMISLNFGNSLGTISEDTLYTVNKVNTVYLRQRKRTNRAFTKFFFYSSFTTISLNRVP